MSNGVLARVPEALDRPVTVEVVDALGSPHRRHFQVAGRQVVSFYLPLPAIAATIDPDQEIADPDRYNNHFPRQVVLTPWPVFSTDSYVLRYFPGLTFKQGQAPVRPESAPMMPPAAGPMGLGVGLEGRLQNSVGWQMLELADLVLRGRDRLGAAALEPVAQFIGRQQRGGGDDHHAELDGGKHGFPQRHDIAEQ